MTHNHEQLAACLKEMYGLRRFGIKLGLDVVTTMLARLGHPHKRYRIVHIAGTNGKGSVAVYLAGMLQAAGFRVGRYTSPHLERFNERICIDDRQVSDRQVVDAWQRAKAAASGLRQPTFFEFTTAMALDIFARDHVDWAVVETGMGGRLDATNALYPELSVITNVSLEHKTYLGSTVAAIAREKAGIIKPGTPVVCGVRQPSALEVIRATADQQQAPLFLHGRQFRTRRGRNGRFSYHGIHRSLKGLRVSLAGDHQVANAALALAALELLAAAEKAPFDEQAVARSLATARWPGRLELVDGTPPVLLDGAHNLAAARNLARHLRKHYRRSQVILVLGILDDKPYKAMLGDLVPCADTLILTRPVIDRAIEPRVLAETAGRLHDKVQVTDTVDRAVQAALEKAASDQMVCIAGSLYVVGEARQALRRLRPGVLGDGGQMPLDLSETIV